MFSVGNEMSKPRGPSQTMMRQQGEGTKDIKVKCAIPHISGMPIVGSKHHIHERENGKEKPFIAMCGFPPLLTPNVVVPGF